MSYGQAMDTGIKSVSDWLKVANSILCDFAEQDRVSMRKGIEEMEWSRSLRRRREMIAHFTGEEVPPMVYTFAKPWGFYR